MPQVIYSEVTSGATVEGLLFKDIKIWLSVRVPFRRRFVDDVRANGGVVVPNETQADVKIVDHLRLDIPDGSYSYKWIEESIQKGALQNLEDHVAAPVEREPRAVGSVARPAKTRRTAFTPEDDRVLIDWVRKYSSKLSGNKMYQDLQYKNPRHTWQSWRSRWVDHKSKDHTLVESMRISAAEETDKSDGSPPQTLEAAPQPTNTEPIEEIENSDRLPLQPVKTAPQLTNTEPTKEIENSDRLSLQPFKTAPQLPNTEPTKETEKSDRPLLQPVETTKQPIHTEPTASSMPPAEEAETGQRVPIGQSEPSSQANPDYKTLDQACSAWRPFVSGADWGNFSTQEAIHLLVRAKWIKDIPEENLQRGWEHWAENFPEHAASQWYEFWATRVQPFHEKHYAEVGPAGEYEATSEEDDDDDNNNDEVSTKKTDNGNISSTHQGVKATQASQSSPSQIKGHVSAPRNLPWQVVSPANENQENFPRPKDQNNQQSSPIAASTVKSAKRKSDALEDKTPDQSPTISIQRSQKRWRGENSPSELGESGIKPDSSDANPMTGRRVLSSSPLPIRNSLRESLNTDEVLSADEPEPEFVGQASQSLSEPEIQEKVDAQIFADIQSYASSSANLVEDEDALDELDEDSRQHYETARTIVTEQHEREISETIQDLHYLNATVQDDAEDEDFDDELEPAPILTAPIQPQPVEIEVAETPAAAKGRYRKVLVTEEEIVEDGHFPSHSIPSALISISSALPSSESSSSSSSSASLSQGQPESPSEQRQVRRGPQPQGTRKPDTPTKKEISQSIKSLDDWITDHQTRNHVRFNTIYAALHACSMNTTLADKLLFKYTPAEVPEDDEELLIPDDVRGVWTTEDDEMLSSLDKGANTDVSSRDVTAMKVALINKHGAEGIQERRLFFRNLKDLEDIGDSNDNSGAEDGEG